MLTITIILLLFFSFCFTFSSSTFDSLSPPVLWFSGSHTKTTVHVFRHPLLKSVLVTKPLHFSHQSLPKPMFTPIIFCFVFHPSSHVLLPLPLFINEESIKMSKDFSNCIFNSGLLSKNV